MIPISGTTRVYPVIGWPVEQVKAPAIYNAYFAKHSIDAICGTPLGMTPGDLMPFSLDNAKPSAVITDCGMKTEITELLRVAAERGHRVQKGKEMLFEQAPLYMERFGWLSVTVDEFRALGVL